MTRTPAPRPELVGLLAACKEHPDDDGPRLVLADWLEEHGEPERAEFIRAQLRHAARLRSEYHFSPFIEPLAEGNDLLARHKDDWFAPYAGCGEPFFQRGLVSLTLTASQLESSRFRRMQDREAWAWVDELNLDVFTLDQPTLKRLDVIAAGGGGNGGRQNIPQQQSQDKPRATPRQPSHVRPLHRVGSRSSGDREGEGKASRLTTRTDNLC